MVVSDYVWFVFQIYELTNVIVEECTTIYSRIWGWAFKYFLIPMVQITDNRSIIYFFPYNQKPNRDSKRIL